MGLIEHEVYVCPVHGETRRVVHGAVPFCVEGDCARDVEVLKYVHPANYRGAVEKLEHLLDHYYRDGNWPSTIPQQENVRHLVLEALHHLGGQ